MNNNPSPVAEIAHFIAKVLAARRTGSEEVPALVASIRDTIEKLRATPGEAVPHEARDATPAAAQAPRRRGRPRKIVAATPKPLTRRVEAEPVIPAMPRLMRRAEVAPAPTQEPPSFEVRPLQNTTLRGVVRWFDLRTRQGALRLPGFGNEIVLDGSVLERAGIARLYKGQEIEATMTGDHGGARLVSIALPGRGEATTNSLFKTGAARRNAKPVVVEMKRDAMRRTAARIEAEHVLGGSRDRSG